MIFPCFLVMRLDLVQKQKHNIKQPKLVFQDFGSLISDWCYSAYSNTQVPHPAILEPNSNK
jgi:hypothetical protein